jgi:hypothetical protein
VVQLMDRLVAIDSVGSTIVRCYAITHVTTSLQSAGAGELATSPRAAP